MAELKTKPTKKSAEAYIKTITPDARRSDAMTLLKMFEEATGEKAVMWGESIVGFGMYHYKSERSSQEGDWPLVGFSPRKQNLTLYLFHGGSQQPTDLLKKLGKHKTSVGCLYINRLADVDEDVLSRLIKECFEYNKKTLGSKKL